jgi:serine/threonine-protein kinase
MLNLGLGYVMITSLALGTMIHWGVSMNAPLDPQISWIGVFLVVFAAIVPVSPRKMLIAGTVSALMNPVGMAISEVHGMAPGAAFASGLLMHYSDFLLVGTAVVISSVVTRLGQQVSKAREMGSYQLGELIKRGGMGEIYKAKHRMLARPAAIKLIRPEMLAASGEDSGDLAMKRFRREAEAAANLRSPHTVELFDFGITEDGTLYFVMELLEGMDLETLVRQHGPMPPQRVVHIMRQVCESLAEAHSQGLIHRDIKPANIHLGRVGVRDDFVKVLDFGLVKSVKHDQTDDSLATAVGRTPGTPAYMAPEMAVGEQTDARADIYALGCVAYFLLTGKLVFDAENTFQMIAKHLRNDPVPPSVRANANVPRPLEDLILACLAKKPDDRPASALELSKKLSSINMVTWSDNEASAWWQRQPVPPLRSSLSSGRSEAALN